jgi:hypothetical protein
LISLSGTRRSLKYRFARRHQEHVDVLNNTTLDISRPPRIYSYPCLYTPEITKKLLTASTEISVAEYVVVVLYPRRGRAGAPSP